MNYYAPLGTTRNHSNIRLAVSRLAAGGKLCCTLAITNRESTGLALQRCRAAGLPALRAFLPFCSARFKPALPILTGEAAIFVSHVRPGNCTQSTRPPKRPAGSAPPKRPMNVSVSENMLICCLGQRDSSSRPRTSRTAGVSSLDPPWIGCSPWQTSRLCRAVAVAHTETPSLDKSIAEKCFAKRARKGQSSFARFFFAADNSCEPTRQQWRTKAYS